MYFALLYSLSKFPTVIYSGFNHDKRVHIIQSIFGWVLTTAPIPKRTFCFFPNSHMHCEKLDEGKSAVNGEASPQDVRFEMEMMPNHQMSFTNTRNSNGTNSAKVLSDCPTVFVHTFKFNFHSAKGINGLNFEWNLYSSQIQARNRWQNCVKYRPSGRNRTCAFAMPVHSHISRWSRTV